MNRITGLSAHLTSASTEQEPLPYTDILYKSGDDMTFSKKLKFLFPTLFFPVWVLSPSFCLYKLLTGGFDTKLNLLLVLIYQYFFHRKTKMLRGVYGAIKSYKFLKEYRVVFEEPLDKMKTSGALFPFHPHGVLVYGMNLAAQNVEFFNTAEVVGSRMSFEIPWGGLVMKFYGVEGANPENFNKLMDEKKNIMFVPGGFEEATLTTYGKDRIFIKHRKGFIKLALEYGYTVYPCYVFGENKLYYTYANETLGLFLNKFKMPGVIPYTAKGVIPHDDVRLITVIGKGIKMPIIPNPTQEYVDKYHKIYMDALIEMYHKYKREFGGSEELDVL